MALIPWMILCALIIGSYLKKEWKYKQESRERRLRIALEYECLFPEDPCIAKHPVFGIECDNCVRYGCNTAKELGLELI